MFKLQVILLFAAVFLSPIIAGRFSAVQALSVQSIVFVSALAWIFRSVKTGEIELPDRKIVITALVFYGLLVFSAVDSVGINASLKELANTGSYLLVFLMVASFRRERKVVYGLLAGLLVSAMIVGAIGLREYMPNALAHMAAWRTFSTFFNPDFLAGFMVTVLPVALAWYLSKTSAGITLVAGLSVLLAIVGLVITGSRFGAMAGLIGVLAFIVIGVVSGSIGRLQIRRLAPLILLALFAFVFLGRPLAGRIANVKSESHSGNFRIYTWLGTARMAKAHPINGTGLGTFEVAYPRYASLGYTTLAHNSYLQVASEAGPIAAIVLLILLGVSICPATAALVRKRVANDVCDINTDASELVWMPEIRLMVSGLLAGAVSSILRNAVDSDWYVTAIGISFWMVIGAAVALSSSTERQGRKLPRSTSVLCMSVLCVMLTGTLMMLSSEIYLAQGKSQLMEQDASGAVDSLHASVQSDPLNPDAHRQLGRIYEMLGTGMADKSFFVRSEQEFRRAISLEPTSPKNYYQLARMYERNSENAKAVDAFKSALAQDPNFIPALLALGQQYEAMGKSNNALDVYRRMVQLEDGPYDHIRAVPELVEPSYIFARAALGRRFEAEGNAAAATREVRACAG